MSVYIKGLEMPKSCAECDAEGHYENSYGDEYGFFCPFGYKAYTEKTRDAKRLDDCHLVIRAMTNEELAMFLGAPMFVLPPWCNMNYDCPYIDQDPARCDLCALDWLKQEATE